MQEYLREQYVQMSSQTVNKLYIGPTVSFRLQKIAL